MKSRKRGPAPQIEPVAGKSRRTRAEAHDSEVSEPTSPPRRRVRSDIQKDLEAMKQGPKQAASIEKKKDKKIMKKTEKIFKKEKELVEDTHEDSGDSSRPVRRSRTSKDSYLKRHFLESEAAASGSRKKGGRKTSSTAGSVDLPTGKRSSSTASSVDVAAPSTSKKATGLRLELDKIVSALSAKVQVECAADGSKGALRNMTKKDLATFDKKVQGSSFVIKRQEQFKDGFALFFEVKSKAASARKKSSRQLQLEERIEEDTAEEILQDELQDRDVSAEEDHQATGGLDESLEEPLEELDEGDDHLLDESLGHEVGREEEVVEEGPVLSPLPVVDSEEDGPLSSSPERHHRVREYPPVPSLPVNVMQHGYDEEELAVGHPSGPQVPGDPLERILYGQSPPQIEHSDDDEQDLKEAAEREARESAMAEDSDPEYSRYRSVSGQVFGGPGALPYLRKPKRRWVRSDRPVWQNPRWVSAAVKDPSLIDEALSEGMTPPQDILSYIENVRCAQKVGGPSVYDVPRSRRKQNFTVPASLRSTGENFRANLVTKMFRPSKTPNILRKSRGGGQQPPEGVDGVAQQYADGAGETPDSKMSPPALLTSSGPHGLQFTTLPTPIAASIQAQLPASAAGALDQAGVTGSAATVTSVAAAGGTGAPKSALEKLQQQRERERLEAASVQGEEPTSAPAAPAAVEEDRQVPVVAQQECLVGVSALGLAERDLPALLRPLRMTVQARGLAYSLLVSPAKEAQVQAAGAGPNEIVFAVLQLSGQPCGTDVLHDLLASVRQFLQDKVERLKQQAPAPPQASPQQLPALSILDQEAIRSQTRAQAGANSQPSLSVVLERPGAGPAGRRLVLQKPMAAPTQPRLPVLPIPGLLAGVGGQPRKILKILKPVSQS